MSWEHMDNWYCAVDPATTSKIIMNQDQYPQPRSLRDDPPSDEMVLAYTTVTEQWYPVRKPPYNPNGPGFTYWLPMPPPPPPPPPKPRQPWEDAYEVYWKNRSDKLPWLASETFSKGWNAALDEMPKQWHHIETLDQLMKRLKAT